ncbi:dihydroneopterin triphosphate diphosphatase [Hydromonas duriensis]|uniref:Dihydroneopterin triphosphate pyrophosphatase n=1 Tax=Hydromonas duriensis TaxID=1527608 RepID=A0A4R6YB37_9BURK|nr:dihydroneopterin triphosphate diphosphatase [Hydromonas duriensis]TDR32778.1 dihydroneopterin triphosphate pyrophosphatase [Hydromonas duriensis]
MLIKKIPISVLVVVYTPDLQVLMMKRTPKSQTGDFEKNFWQCITGSLDFLDEKPRDAAVRELFEETGLRADDFELQDWQHQSVYEIFPEWRHRYAEGVVENVEHWFGLRVPSTRLHIQLEPQEHTEYKWLPFEEAATLCFSWNNANAIRSLPERNQ